MRVLVVGSGAREHALVWKLRFSPEVTAVYAAPGNAGISFLAHTEPVPAHDIDGLRSLAREFRIDLTVVGPEVPLANGIVDAFEALHLRVFGPNQAAAEIESSKIFAKELMRRHNIPTPRWELATSPDEARAHAEAFGFPVVLKADGLAGGKGAVVCQTMEEAEDVIRQFMLDRSYGAAGDRLVVEEFLRGEELSVFALADGATILPLIGVRDYKRLGDRDQGPNTGGMGGYAPSAYATPQVMAYIRRTILEPTVRAMAAEGRPYKGVLYAGLMLTREGPRVLEYNCRWGDPEAQILLPLLKTDIMELMDATIDGTLAGKRVEWSDQTSCGVVLASRGYPGSSGDSVRITGLDEIDDGVLVFHGATRVLKTPPPSRGWLRRGVRRTTEADIGFVTDGGRVVTVVATGQNLTEAREKVYANVDRIHFEGMQHRTDIGAIETRSSRQAARTAEARGGEGEAAAGAHAVAVVDAAGAAASSLAPSEATPAVVAAGLSSELLADKAEREATGGGAEMDAAVDTEAAAGSSGMEAQPEGEPSAIRSELSREKAESREQASAAVSAPRITSLVAVIMGSESDRSTMEEGTKILTALGIPHEIHVMSAHRTPERVREFAQNARSNGFEVIIAGAGGAAHLPGVIAAQTTLPVIGVPMQTSMMGGLDSLLSIVQMPGGVPVATVATGNAGARNAAYLAAGILSLQHADVCARYQQFRRDQSGIDIS